MPLLEKAELVQLISVMKAMHSAAISEDWEELSLLDVERRNILNYDASTENAMAQVADKSCADQDSHTPSAETPTHDPQHTALIKEVQALDQRILESVQTSREKLLHQNRDFNAQIKAKQVYAQTSLIS